MQALPVGAVARQLGRVSAGHQKKQQLLLMGLPRAFGDNLLTLLSYIALNVDIVFQTKHIYQTKSSRDLSLTGMSIRYAAI